MTDESLICAPNSTLSEVLDKYLILRGVDKKKYFARYMVVAGEVWAEVFRNTMFITKSVWKTIQKGTPYNYIVKPKDLSRLISISVDDGCGEMKALYYNSNLNTLVKPSSKTCGCTSCSCELCEDVANFVMTTREVFTVGGVTYYEKKWLKYCPNGDIIEYRELPVKKYNDFLGDAGDFNNDFNNDFDIGDTGFANFEIIIEKLQRKICSLAVRPCGCPDATEANLQLLVETCGCYISDTCCSSKIKCERFLGSINDNCLGEVKIGECGTKIYFKANRKQYQDKKIPEFLQVNYQTNGRIPDAETQVPDDSDTTQLLFAGFDFFSKRYSGAYSPYEKDKAMYAWEDQKGKYILNSNLLDLHQLAQIQDAEIKW